jgi:predicted component of type VI protein secretion system
VVSLVMGLPLDLAFRTKGQLAIDIATEALADGARFDFFCGDETSDALSCQAATARVGAGRLGKAVASS